MPDRFGRFVLLEELETGWRGAECRAAALAGPDLERLVSLLRVSPALAEGETLLEHLRAAARLGGPHAIAIHEVGRVDGAAFVASDLVEGKSLRAVLGRCRKDAMPIAPDNALQIASRVAAAVEHAHGQTPPAGGPFVHGMVGPDNVIVSYEGEVSVRGFGWWTSRAWEGHLPEEQVRRLAPEQREGVADPRSDVFGVGALLLECLSRSPPDAPLDQARLPDGEPLPPPIADVLAKALRPDPAGRYADIRELRRTLDALLFSGDFSPTTFNLAFFMYTLYRDVVEVEARRLERERQARYADPAPAAPHQAPAAATVPPLPSRPPAGVATAVPPLVRATVPREAAPVPHAAVHPAKASPARPVPARATAHRATPGVGLAVQRGLVAAFVATVAAGAIFFLRAPSVPAPTPPPTQAPEEVAALARVRELEARLLAIEEERAQAEAAAAEAARQRLEAEAARKGRAVDRAAVAKAQEEAARQARADEEQRQETERRRIAESMLAEEARLQADRASALPTPTSTPLPSPSLTASPTATAADVAASAPNEPPPPSSGPTSTTGGAPVSTPPSKVVATAPVPAAAAAAPGEVSAPVVHAAGAPGVTAPVLQKSAPVEYPQLAKATRAQGAVVVTALVDEKGRVSEARAVSPGNEILRQAAVAHVLQRRYLPGRKDGVPVRVRIVVYVTFRFQN